MGIPKLKHIALCTHVIMQQRNTCARGHCSLMRCITFGALLQVLLLLLPLLLLLLRFLRCRDPLLLLLLLRFASVASAVGSNAFACFPGCCSIFDATTSVSITMAIMLSSSSPSALSSPKSEELETEKVIVPVARKSWLEDPEVAARILSLSFVTTEYLFFYPLV